MNTEFGSAYKQLNTAQKIAVDTIEGPILVVAGPGTGKTQLLSLRVANILQKTDADPSNILCLTFTNFAATNMRDRLTKLVGPTAHNVVIRTFHSFAAEIMNQYPDYFWNGANLSVAPDTVQLELIESIISQLPLSNPLALKFAGAYTAVNDVQQALRLSKEAGLTPEKLAAMIDVNMAYLDVIEPLLVDALSPKLSIKKLGEIEKIIDEMPVQNISASIAPLTSLSTVIQEGLRAAIAQDLLDGKTTQTGKWKRRWIQTVSGEQGMHDERKRNQWWAAIAPVYKTYRDSLHKRGYYDYSDMLVEVLSQLEQKPDLLSRVREQFMYLMIDEFQDSNAAQLRLAHLVAGSIIKGEEPNLLAVGDDDQTIFAFNGAEINNMLTFRRTYKTSKLVVLQQNYRSTQPILDTAKNVIENADDRLVKREKNITKNLVASSNISEGDIKHFSYPTHAHQLSGLADYAAEHWRNNDGQTLAILARSHSSLRQISQILNAAGVPISYEQQNNALQHPLVQQICLVAEAADYISKAELRGANYTISRLLQHAAWGIKSATLWNLALENQSNPDWLTSLSENADKQLSSIGSWLFWLSRQSVSEPLDIMLDYILGLRGSDNFTSPLRDYFVQRKEISSSYINGLSALSSLSNAVNEFTLFEAENTKLEDFVRFIRLHSKLGRTITDESWFASGENAIQLMTVHKAKGLEFDTVIILDAVEDNWRPRHIGRKPPANMPLQPYGEQYDDYVRLLYVASTRAKRTLIYGSHSTDDRGRALLATPMISHLEETRISQDKIDESVPILESYLIWPRLDTKNERALLAKRLENYKLSVTALLQFLDVTNGGPNQFLERQLLKIPQLQTSEMAYGTAIHKALQSAQLLTNSNEFDLQLVLNNYDKALLQQQLPLSEQERYIEHGRNILKNLFERDNFEIYKGDSAEVVLNDLVIGSARLSGNLDSVHTDKKSVIITDYKTGVPLSSFDTKAANKELKAWRHRTQLIFYVLLASNSSRFKSAIQFNAQMLYVEAENQTDLRLLIEPDTASLRRLEKLVDKVWAHIIGLNFPDVSKYSMDAKGIEAFENDLLNNNL